MILNNDVFKLNKSLLQVNTSRWPWAQFRNNPSSLLKCPNFGHMTRLYLERVIEKIGKDPKALSLGQDVFYWFRICTKENKDPIRSQQGSRLGQKNGRMQYLLKASRVEAYTFVSA